MSSNSKFILGLLGASFTPIFIQADQPIQSEAPKVQYLSGEAIKTGDLPGAYNESATYSCCEYADMFITADYVYWKWSQDNIQVGTLVDQTGITYRGNSTAVLRDPGYTSGFQVGAGFNLHGMDDWNLYSEYSWYKNTDNQTVTSTVAQALVLPPALIRPDLTIKANHLVGTVQTETKMGFQSADFLMQRPFYFGKKLTASFGAGLRAQWITQHLTFSSNSLTIAETSATVTYSNDLKQTTWGLGPKFGFDVNWLLGYGLKVMTNISGSFLYTSYNVNIETTTNDVTVYGNYLHNYGTVRPVTEAFLGLGWGSYLGNDHFHIDLSAGYDFNAYWNYNMLYSTTGQSVGSMYLQGLNIQARFDF